MDPAEAMRYVRAEIAAGPEWRSTRDVRCHGQRTGRRRRASSAVRRERRGDRIDCDGPANDWMRLSDGQEHTMDMGSSRESSFRGPLMMSTARS